MILPKFFYNFGQIRVVLKTEYDISFSFGMLYMYLAYEIVYKLHGKNMSRNRVHMCTCTLPVYCYMYTMLSILSIYVTHLALIVVDVIA